MADKSLKQPHPIVRMVKAHPWITGIFVFCVMLCIGLCLYFLPEDWSLLRKVVAGIVAGLFSALIITATKTVGHWD